jgi:hypothetical protein
MREGTTSRVMAADRPYGEFYDFYSVSPEYSGFTLVCAECGDNAVCQRNVHERAGMFRKGWKKYC